MTEHGHALPLPASPLLAPERCVRTQECVSATHVAIVGYDLGGVMRVRVELHRDDVSHWWVMVLRYWLALRYGAAGVRILG